MTNPSLAPAPWRVVVYHERQWIDVVAADNTIISCHDTEGEGGQREAGHAALISALPNLLEALTRIATCCDDKAKSIARAALTRAGNPTVGPLHPNVADVLKEFVTEIRAYQSPECEDSDIMGPLLDDADQALAGIHPQDIDCGY